jgi:hypothetical protein
MAEKSNPSAAEHGWLSHFPYMKPRFFCRQAGQPNVVVEGIHIGMTLRRTTMRQFGTPILAVTVISLFAATTSAQPDYGYYYYPDSPELIAREADAMSNVLSKIDSPQRRSQLAEQWIQFSRQAIERSLNFRDQWLAVQKRQVANQEESQQLRVELLKMQGDIERLRAENLKLQNENLQLQMQLKGQMSAQAAVPAPETLPQAAAPEAQPTPGK